MSKKALRSLKKKFKKDIVDSHDRLGDETIVIRPDALRAICTFLNEDPKMACDMLKDVTAVDYLRREPRFEVVYILYSLKHKHHFRVRVLVDEADPAVPSVCDIWRAANWAEREVWDMYGITFDGHPDLRRILMYEEFEGHPLRKDYPIQQSQPRMDLVKQERDAVEEYRRWQQFDDDARAEEGTR